MNTIKIRVKKRHFDSTIASICAVHGTELIRQKITKSGYVKVWISFQKNEEAFRLGQYFSEQLERDKNKCYKQRYTIH